MSKRLKSLLLVLVLLPCSANATQCVVLLHGLIRSADSMQTLQKALEAEHYKVVNQGYASTKGTIKTLANTAIPRAIKTCGKAQQIHFITHSLGGILVRQYLSEHKVKNLGRVVMLGPPNQGSEVVDVLGSWALFRWLHGPAGDELGTQQTSTPNKLGAVNFPLGVIAGNRSINFILSTFLPGADDGKVTVANTKVKGMQAHLVLPVTHPFMMKNKQVIKQAVYFLKNGAFKVGDKKKLGA